jgi:hypothetical protein
MDNNYIISSSLGGIPMVSRYGVECILYLLDLIPSVIC